MLHAIENTCPRVALQIQNRPPPPDTHFLASILSPPSADRVTNQAAPACSPDLKQTAAYTPLPSPENHFDSKIDRTFVLTFYANETDVLIESKKPP